MRYVVQKELIVSNLNRMRTHCPTAEVICVVKGNGYGLGLVNMAKLLTENGAATLAVSRVDEAVKLRENGIESNILLLSPPFDEKSAKTVVELNIIALTVSLPQAFSIKRQGTRAKKQQHTLCWIQASAASALCPVRRKT